MPDVVHLVAPGLSATTWGQNNAGEDIWRGRWGGGDDEYTTIVLSRTAPADRVLAAARDAMDMAKLQGEPVTNMAIEIVIDNIQANDARQAIARATVVLQSLLVRDVGYVLRDVAQDPDNPGAYFVTVVPTTTPGSHLAQAIGA